MQDALQSAASLRSAQDAQLRKAYDSRPPYTQHSLFHGRSREVRGARAAPLQERLALSAEWRRAGNAALGEGRLGEAVNFYERALALWVYYTSTAEDPNAIADATLRLHRIDALPEVGGERAAAAAEAALLYNNIAAAALKGRAVASIGLGSPSASGGPSGNGDASPDYALAVTAASDALALDPSNAKARYRRAKALFEWPSSGGTGAAAAAATDALEQARDDLLAAVAAASTTAPSSAGSSQAVAAECRQLLSKVRAAIARRDAALRGAMHAALKADDFVVPESGVAAAASHRAASDTAGRRRRREEQTQTMGAGPRPSSASADSPGHGSLPPDIDFAHPSPGLLAAAEKLGVDLSDPQVQAELRKIQRTEIKKRARQQAGAGESATNAIDIDDDGDGEESETVDISGALDGDGDGDGNDDATGRKRKSKRDHDDDDDGKESRRSDIEQLLSRVESMNASQLRPILDILRKNDPSLPAAAPAPASPPAREYNGPRSAAASGSTGPSSSATGADSDVEQLRALVRDKLQELIAADKASDSRQQWTAAIVRWGMVAIVVAIALYNIARLWLRSRSVATLSGGGDAGEIAGSDAVTADLAYSSDVHGIAGLQQHDASDFDEF